MNNKQKKINKKRQENHLYDKSNKLARLVYQITKGFPKEESYGITSQLSI
jgi:hypothetical protein